MPRIEDQFAIDIFRRTDGGEVGRTMIAEPGLAWRRRRVRILLGALGLVFGLEGIGVDDQDPGEALFGLARMVTDAGTDAIWVHARKAWLEGLSPKENRDIPPLDYEIVYRLKAQYPNLFIGINGGVKDLNQARAHREHVDGVMLGRAAYHEPGLLAEADRAIYGDSAPSPDMRDVVLAMADYADRHVAAGGRANQVTRHMVGLFHGVPGARQWRQHLSTEAVKAGATGDVLRDALKRIDAASRAAA